MTIETPISKTQRKKERHALQELGVELVALSDEQLAAIELPEILRDAVLEARRITDFEGRRRQMQYIGKLMRKVDAAPIRARLDAWKTQARAHTAQFKRIEAWRERLLAERARSRSSARISAGRRAQLRGLIATRGASGWRTILRKLSRVVSGSARADVI